MFRPLRSNLLTLGASLMALSGCGLIEVLERGPGLFEDVLSTTRIALDDASVAGSFERARDFDTDVRGEVWIDEYAGSDDCPAWSNGTLVGEVPGGAVMQGFSMDGSLYDDRFAPGAHIESNWEAEWSDDSVWIDVYGCTGPVEGDWEYDEGATHVVLDVEADPEFEGARLFVIQATYANGERVVSRFTLPPRSAGAPEVSVMEPDHEDDLIR